METTLTILHDRALAAHEADCAEAARRRLRDQSDRCESHRRSFGWALGRVLDLSYDRQQDFPDRSFPGLLTDKRDDEEQFLRYEQDGLTFAPHGASEHQVSLLLACGRCGQNQAPRLVTSLSHLGQELAAETAAAAARRRCSGCRAAEEAAAEAARLAAGPAPDPAPDSLPPPPLSVEERLTAAIRDLIESRFEQRDEAESTREYYRSEREERKLRHQAEELRRVEEQHRSDTYRLEDDLRRTQDQLKRQQRGW